MSYKILGVNKRSYPGARPDKDIIGCSCLGCGAGYVDIVVVLVEGGMNDYAAYIGSGPDYWVAANGDKLSFAEARIHFPGIEEERYRT